MRSEQIKTGVERTPNRSLLYALGYTDAGAEHGYSLRRTGPVPAAEGDL